MFIETDMKSVFRDPVFISGAGCVTAAGRSFEDTMRAMGKGSRDPRPSSVLRGLHETAFPVFSVPDEWLAEVLGSLPRFERCGELAWMAAREALVSAGIDVAEADRHRIGICLGTVAGAAIDDISFHQQFRTDQCPEIEPVKRFMAANPAAQLQEKMNLRGPFLTVTTACTSGASAIAEAARWVRHGLCDIALAGGTEKISRLTYSGFISLRITDAEPCRPFDFYRRGLNLGEGAGILVLESASSLRRRQTVPLAKLIGEGNSCNSYHLSRPHPDGNGLRRALEQTLQEAKLKSSELSFINAHGTATPDNDRVEGRLFAELLPGVPFYSSKAYTGHTLGAAGGIEAVLTLGSLLQGSIPATAGFCHPDPEIGAVPTREQMKVSGKAALSTSVAYGGNNVVLALGL